MILAVLSAMRLDCQNEAEHNMIMMNNLQILYYCLQPFNISLQDDSMTQKKLLQYIGYTLSYWLIVSAVYSIPLPLFKTFDINVIGKNTTSSPLLNKFNCGGQ